MTRKEYSLARCVLNTITIDKNGLLLNALVMDISGITVEEITEVQLMIGWLYGSGNYMASNPAWDSCAGVLAC